MALEKAHRTSLWLVTVVSLCGCAGFLFWERLDAPEKQTLVLDNRINPNQASVGSLTRLPGIGPERAQSIVTYREKFKTSRPEGIPFQTPEDLQNVKGIGPATLEGMSPWLDLTSESFDQ